MVEYKKGSEVRKSDFPVDSIFLDRWSPRAMSSEDLTDEELMTLFEAARWAPSSNNEQPWRFVYAKKRTSSFDKFFDILVEFNKMWAKNAAVLVFLIAKKTFTKSGESNRNHMSDAGAAWENLALQGSLKGYVVHGMAGYDVEKARKELKIPEDYEVVHVFAIGKPAEKEVLHERMQKSESPNDRKPIKEFIFEGKFGNDEEN